MRTARTYWLAAASFLALPAFGATIVSDLYNGFTSGNSGGFHVVTWTQTGSYTGVSIGANLGTANGLSTSTGTAYLMDLIGPTATSLNEVTAPFSISVTGNPSINTMTPLFSGLSLGPGTYYLVINPTSTGQSDSLDWALTGTPLQTLDSGVTQGTDLTNSGAVAGFPPASSTTTEANSLIFVVNGTMTTSMPPTPSGTPEPSSLALAALGFSALAAWRFRRQTPQQ
jgi:MYXO-CTERM domain-containing protein